MDKRMVMPIMKISMVRKIDCSEYFNCWGKACRDCPLESPENYAKFKEQEQ